MMNYRFYLWFCLLLSILLSACSSAPVVHRPETIFHDALFTRATETVNADSLFGVSDKMRDFITEKIQPQLKSTTHQHALFNALYNKTQLSLEYDSTRTRNAAETFELRSGNCLSLVIMTAALAKELGMSVQYQNVLVDENWSRSGELYFSSGHVNIVLGRPRFDHIAHLDKNSQMTVDFLPPEDTAGQRTIDIEEKTIIAMFMNNRAAEELARNDINQAYWFAREAIMQDDQFAPAYNTLGVIYFKHQNDNEALVALSHARKLAPQNSNSLANTIQVLSKLGRLDEAKQLNAQLEKSQPVPPFHYFKQGVKAMEKQEYAIAKSLFEQEIARAPTYHEFHFWLGVAYYRLGNFVAAAEQLEVAKENSTNQKDYALYGAKLAVLKAQRKHQN